MPPACGSADRITTTPSTGSREVARLLLDDLAHERVPERRLAAGHELAAEIAAEVAELLVADVAGELGPRLQRRLDRLEPQRQHDRPHPRDLAAASSLDRALDERQRLLLDRSEHEHGDPLPGEAVLDEDRIGALDEVLRGLLAALEVVGRSRSRRRPAPGGRRSGR